MRNLLTLFVVVSLTFSCGTQKKSAGDSPSPGPQGKGETESFPGEALSDQRVFRAVWNWDQNPAAETKLTANLKFLSPSADTAEGDVADVAVDPWMPTMGHGTYTDEQTITPLPGEPGSFRIQGIYLIMGGPWELKITATLRGVRDVARISVQVD